MSSLPSNGSVIVAVAISSGTAAVRASAVAGQRRQAIASGSARNGSAGIRKRGPGDPRRTEPVARVVGQVDQEQAADHIGLGPQAAAVHQDDPDERQPEDRRQREQALVRHQQVDADLEVGQVDAEEATVVQPHHVVARCPPGSPRRRCTRSAAGCRTPRCCRRREGAPRPRPRPHRPPPAQRAAHRVDAEHRGGEPERVLAGDREARQQPGRPNLSSRGGPARSRQSSAKAANASVADMTCEKKSVEKGRISVPMPSATAAAVP